MYTDEEICGMIRKNRPNFLNINGPYIARSRNKVAGTFCQEEGESVILDIRTARVMAIFPRGHEEQAKAATDGMNMAWILAEQEKNEEFEFYREIPAPFRRAVLYNFANNL